MLLDEIIRIPLLIVVLLILLVFYLFYKYWQAKRAYRMSCLYSTLIRLTDRYGINQSIALLAVSNTFNFRSPEFNDLEKHIKYIDKEVDNAAPFIEDAAILIESMENISQEKKEF